MDSKRMFEIMEKEGMTQYQAVSVALDSADHASAALGLSVHLDGLSGCALADRIAALMAELLARKATL